MNNDDFAKDYKSKKTKVELLDKHFESALLLSEQEDIRQETIDAKAKQILFNSGIILILFGAVSMLAMDHQIISHHLNLFWSIATLLLLLIALAVSTYVLSFNRNERPDNINIFKENYSKENDFIKEQVIAHLEAAEINAAINSSKSQKIKMASVMFGTALFVAVLMLCTSLVQLSHQETKGPQLVTITNEQLNFKAIGSDVVERLVPTLPTSGRLYFGYKTYSLAPASIDDLNGVVTSLTNVETTKVYITGHTDIVGSDAYNQNLSKLRAGNVKKFLMKNGISETRIELDFKGEEKLADSSNTHVAAGINRRVEWLIK